MPKEKPSILIIAGPTASGKSRLAHDLGVRMNGRIINADSMQVYAPFPILTAQPGAAERAALPHALYGHVMPPAIGSAASWKMDVEREITATLAAGQLPILVGGTGLYLEFLLHGLSAIPDVPEEIQSQARAEYADDPVRVTARLAEIDPETAARLLPNDMQRTVRAYAVFLATGEPLGAWQKKEFQKPVHEWRHKSILLNPPRDALYAAIDGRFEKMLEQGALDEVKAAPALPHTHPAMKAIGARELQAYLEGCLSLQDASASARQASRNYAKRQVTWFRNRFLKKEAEAGYCPLFLEKADYSQVVEAL